MECDALRSEMAQLRSEFTTAQQTIFNLTNQVKLLEQENEKKNIQIQRNKVQQQEMLKEVSDFQEQIKKYKEKAKSEREVYEKLLFRSDKLINYLYNGNLVMSRSLGKVLHHLLLKIPFDVKEITGKILVEDVSKLHEWVMAFEKSDFLKKAKIYRNIGDKVHFYKKLELPLLQDAYNKLFEAVKNSKTVIEEGEYSQLNATLNYGNMSTNKSTANLGKGLNLSKLGEEEYNPNILDELSSGAAGMMKKDSITELLVRFNDRIMSDQLTELPPVLFSDFIKKFKDTVDIFHSRVVSISLEPKNNVDEDEKMKVALTPEELVVKNNEFHLDCLAEMQSKLRYLETRFSYIKLILETRDVTKDEMTNLKMKDLLQRNRDINEEDFALNFDEKANTDLIKMLEESFIQKDKIFKAKKQFIEHLNNIKEDFVRRLQRVFEGLNNAEDEYTLAERALMNLQSAITLNQQETKNFLEKAAYSKAQKEEFEKKVALLKEEVNSMATNQNKLIEEKENYERQTRDQENEIKRKTENFSVLRKELSKSKLEYYETVEKLIYIDELQAKISSEMEGYKKQAESKQSLLKEKMEKLKSIVFEKKGDEKTIKEAEEKLAMLEGKIKLVECSCKMNAETKKEMEKIKFFFEKSSAECQKYDFYVKMIEDFMNSNDVNFNQFLKLTVTSTMSLNDKISKIHKSLKERNMKLIEHISEIIEKTYIESCSNLINNYLTSAEKSPEKTLNGFTLLKKEMNLDEKIKESMDPLEYLKQKVKLFKNFEEMVMT